MCSQLTTDFPDDVLEPLNAAGWHPNRRVPTAQWITALEGEGYECFSLAREFLECFGGLALREILKDDSAFSPGRTRLQPVLAASGEFDRVNDWQNEHELRLFPVGNCFDEYFILMISPDENFYAGSYDDELLLIANNTRDCFKQLLHAPWNPVTLQQG
jgi:hypothetical protein